jgi:hypothetical protein
VSSIFPQLSLDPSRVCWHDFLMEPTPVERVGMLLFKREDYFAPLGYGGINGAKLRQLIHLMETSKREGGASGLLTGASVKSPQIPMGAAVARHYGVPSLIVVGATHPKAAVRNPMVKMGAWFGARYDLEEKIAYNPILQRKVKKLHDSPQYRDYFVLEYGITRDHTCHPPEKVLAFHGVGAEQVRNFPEGAKRVVIPAGSCNSATSILHGIAKFRPPNLEDIYLIGIGPSKLRLIAERLKIFQDLTGIDHAVFSPSFSVDLPVLSSEGESAFFMPEEKARPYRLHYVDLHGTKQVKYHDWVPWEYGGIQFHPTYEGKVMRWMFQQAPELVRPDTLFWIVGSEPSLERMAPFQEELGEFPESIEVAS